MPVAVPITPKPVETSISALLNAFPKLAQTHIIDFLRNHNGAVPPDNIVRLSDGRETSVRRFISVENMASVHCDVDEFPEHVVPIGFDDGGNYFYALENGAIWFWDHEVQDGEIKIADSFQDFLNMLEPFDQTKISVNNDDIEIVSLDKNWKPEFD
jgi:hypothetical protein